MKVLVTCLLLALASAQTIQPEMYECGSECQKNLMDSKDPNADAMPHSFGSFVPKSAAGLANTMNAYLKDDPVHRDDVIMVPRPHAVMPEAIVSAEKATNCAEHEATMVPTGPVTLPTEVRIPYIKAEDKPALRRPCNLDEILDLLRSIKNNMQGEDVHDTKLHTEVVDGMSPLAAAQAHLKESEDTVADLEKSKKANETLTNVIETIRIKAQLQSELMQEKANLLSSEGQRKGYIVKSIGRTNINLQNAVAAKQAALNDFSQHPSITKEEATQLIASYDALIIHIKNTLSGLHTMANDELTPIHLNINQTEHKITQLDTELGQLKKEQETLTPVAEKYTPASLKAAQLVYADALAHFNAEKSGQDIDVSSFDQRAQDRSSIIHLVDEMIALVSDIQEPQDPTDQYVEVRQPVSLSGSVPQRSSV